MRALREISNIFKRTFSSYSNLKYVNNFEMTHYNKNQIPILNVLDKKGQVLNGEIVNQVPHETVFSAFKQMIQLRIFENIMLDAQRQGRNTFLMKSTGEEAIGVGCAAALNKEDWIHLQYREASALLWRGFTFEKMMDELIGTIDNPSKGRSMPMNYSYPEGNIFQCSAPLATQMTQAVGSAYAFKLQNKGICMAIFLGDGANSEGDSQVSYNMAATLKCPILFLCRNNQYAISTNASKQFATDGPADHALGNGIAVMKVDGCDIFAIYHAVQKARNYCVEKNLPVFIEFVSYRQGDHSTSDDSTAYRTNQELGKSYKDFNPIERLSLYFRSKGQWTLDQEKALESDAHKDVIFMLKKCENKRFHPINEILDDVYDELSYRHKKQRDDLLSHLRKYANEYDLSRYNFA